MKKITLTLLLLVFAIGSSFSQCIGTTPYITATSNNSGLEQSISVCNFGGDYNTINGIIIGDTYRFSSTAPSVTITDLSNNVLGFGSSPVVITGITVASIRFHTHSSLSPGCGTASSCFTTSIQDLSVTPPPPPANDLCAYAIVLTGDGVVAGTTVFATVDTAPVCVTTVSSPGVWYTFTDVSGTGSTVDLSLCTGTSFDTKLSVYTGSCGTFTCVTGNDDSCGVQSAVNFTTDGSSTYYILVHSFGTATGVFDLTVSGFPVIASGNPPTIACPADITINNAAGTCGAVANFAGVAFDDEDGNISGDIIATPASGTTFPVGVTTVELSVTDSDNNTVTCSFTVTVLDNEAPVAVCQDITVDLDPITGIATITGADIDNGSTDNCGIASLSVDISSFDCSMTGANTVILTVTDNSGNSTDCTATVTVQDVTAPEIVCIGGVATITESEDFEGASVPAGWSTNIVLGTADWAFGSGSMPIGGDFPTNAAIFDDDAAGSEDNIVELLSPVYDLTGTTSAEISFDYALQDFVGLGLLRGEVWDGSAWQEVFLADNADIDPVNTGAIDVFAYANAAFQVKFTFDDELGWNWGAGVDNFLLTYEAAAGGGLDVYLDASGMATVNPNDLVLSVNEACGYTITAGGAGGGTMGSLTTLFATNNGGSSGWAVMYDITVGPTDIEVTELDINTAATTAFTLDLYVLEGTYVGNEINPAAWGAVAASGSGTGAGADLPSNVVLGAPVVLSANTTYGFAVITTGVGQSYTNGTGCPGNQCVDNADLSISLGSAVTGLFTGSVFTPRVWNGTVHYTTVGGTGLEFTCADLGENIVEVTVTDASGNASTCFATVNVIDNIAPVLVCQDATIELGPDGTTTIDPYTLLASFDEACGITSIAVDVPEVNCSDIGTSFTVTVFASDASGNIASCTSLVTVVDLLAPVLTCPADQTVDPGAGNLFYIVPDYIATGEATAIDNCTDPVTITTQDPAPGTALSDGTYTITMTATDEYGNTSTCDFELTIETVLGVNSNSLDKGLALYPNPADNVVNLVNKTNIALETMMIYDINGKLVNQTDLRTMQGAKAVDVSSLASGVYMVQIIGDSASTVKRLIKE